MGEDDVLFRENQGPPGTWWVNLVLSLAPYAAAAWLFARWEPGYASFLRTVAPFVALVAVARALGRMRTVVTPRFLDVSSWPVPFHRRTVVTSDIVDATPISYDPSEYGGWGWRWTADKGLAYTTRGERGVLVTLARGETFLLGSQRPEHLAAAIALARVRVGNPRRSPLLD